MKIYVPSAGRAGRFGSVATTFDLVREATLVVPSDEKERYERAARRMMQLDPRRRYEVMGCGCHGIAAVRKMIGELAAHRKEDKFCMVDDDLTFAVRQSPDGYHLRKATTQDVEDLFKWIEFALFDDVAHASVSIRGLNNVYPTGDVAALTKYNKRTLRLLAYQTKPFLMMKHGRVTVMEDFDVNLQLLRSGRRNATTFWWTQDQRGTGVTTGGEAGGCSTYRTREAHNESAKKLAELHPQFVKIREKHTKTSSAELRDRLEPTIQWERAYASSQRVKA